MSDGFSLVEMAIPVMVAGLILAAGMARHRQGRPEKRRGSFHVHGGVIAGATNLDDPSMIAGSTKIAFSTCALRRAVSHSDVAEPRALAERPWYQKR